MTTRTRMGRVLAAALLVLWLSVVAWAQAQGTDHGRMTGDVNSVNGACSHDAQIAGCENATVGHGLLKCLNTYKKAHKDFRLSQGCHQAIKRLREDRRERKGFGTPAQNPKQ